MIKLLEKLKWERIYERNNSSGIHNFSAISYPVHIELQFLEKGPKIVGKHLAYELDERGIDFLFIDGDHSYGGCLRELTIYGTYVKNGICALHDANSSGVRRAINAYFWWSYWKISYQNKNRWVVHKPKRCFDFIR